MKRGLFPSIYGKAANLLVGGLFRRSFRARNKLFFVYFLFTSFAYNLPVPVAFASGGTITYTDSSGLNPRSSPAYVGGYVVETFTTSGTFTPPAGVSTVDYLIVGGGGGGGSYINSFTGGGGGGGGGMLTGSVSVSSGSPYTVTIGAGAAGGTGGVSGSKGSDSSFNGLTSVGGGGGGGSSAVGAAGGSGGGGGGLSAIAGGSGTAGQGNNGATSGGGGGAGSVGVTGGAGGSGNSTAISGASVIYAGGGGWARVNSAGAGGSGGGGAGGGFYRCGYFWNSKSWWWWWWWWYRWFWWFRYCYCSLSLYIRPSNSYCHQYNDHLSHRSFTHNLWWFRWWCCHLRPRLCRNVRMFCDIRWSTFIYKCRYLYRECY